ncbi:MAG TPA: DUF6569 family protein [Pyrinomonadaceae bacterium]|nr:DUF6569 family protein [Pyrinomonadaceae bacterium]
MKKQAFVLTLGVVLLSVVAGVLINAQTRRTSFRNGEVKREPVGQPTTVQEGNYRLSGPYTHKNLTIFLVHGKNVFEGKTFITLQEAMVQKKVVVYETKSVNELAIENLSNDDIYVQAGEIVKGGQQDRMIGVDLIVPRKSGKMPIAAFCVEHGRWSGRGSERTTVFSSSSDSVATRSIKLAAKKSNSQGAVWESVTVAQDKLSQNVGARVNSAVSESSLQLAVEHSKVRATADSYIKSLVNIVDGRSDVIGYVFAINGKVNSADVYGSSQLFKKLWPKLLKANAIEAIAELQTEKFAPAKPEHAKSFLTDGERAKATQKEVSKRVGLVTGEDSENVFFETRDRAQKDAWVHRNYIKKH